MEPELTISKIASEIKPILPELDEPARQSEPYTLAQVIENLALMHGSQDLTWCRWVATDIMERGIDALPTAQAQSRTPLEKAAPELLAAAQTLIAGCEAHLAAQGYALQISGMIATRAAIARAEKGVS